MKLSNDKYIHFTLENEIGKIVISKSIQKHCVLSLRE